MNCFFLQNTPLFRGIREEEIEAMLPRYTGNNAVKNTYGAMDENDIKKILEKMK